MKEIILAYQGEMTLKGLNRRSDKALAPHPTPCADA